ncbi:MAG: maleylpyruvate isomerase family mycothiol-dependent enzyme, partial [Acidimicrobiaceae bacterium]|nr:maleylpyruvate isomerase family mycothiol-dependent enzyme [Acidimicrobiaceae bacterium]
ASMLTARLMETWAHGIDIRDSLGLAPNDSRRLAHVCFLGYRTRAFSFTNRGLAPPENDVFIELKHQQGLLSYGNPNADNRISGTSLDFALVVTQRRHLLDTSLVVEGKDALEWMQISQAFAGPPGPGRQPG